MKYVALLRGINVGGNNLIPMPKLKACFESMGFSNVSTYIQSGNVLFESKSKSATSLTKQIEATLSKKFKYKSRVVVLSEADLKTTVTKAPKGFGKEPLRCRYDVVFFLSKDAPKKILATVPLREGVDQGWAGKRVLYLNRIIAQASKSHISKLISLPIYKEMTIRNWNTTTKLLERMK